MALDDMLTRLLVSKIDAALDDKSLDHIFRFEGPLGSFSARIGIAYLFRFIDDVSRNQLSLIREVRNACAHSPHAIAFATKELAAVTRRFLRHPEFHPQPTDTE